MNIVFLTIGNISDISSRGIYTDLMRKFRDEGHEVFIATPTERRYKQKTSLIKNNNITILKIKTLNIQRTNVLEKGISTLLIEYQFLNAIKKYFSKICFDLVLYSTPPVTFTKVVSYIKKKDGASSYLLLKDIFPQNAVDISIIRKDSFFHKYFRKMEKRLYSVSDFIGCMSPANIRYILEHNPEVNPSKVELNPNSIEPFKSVLAKGNKSSVRQKYKIPYDSIVYIYGGNLGKPQGIDFIIQTLDSQKENMGVFFIVAGSGTEYPGIKSWFDQQRPKNTLLLSVLPKNDFDLLLQACDVGMIFLDRRFTIPNFPSRLLSYLEFKMPVIAATDKSTDLRIIIEENEFGLWSESGDLQGINNNIAKISQTKVLRDKMGISGYNYMLNNYTVTNSYNTIMKHFEINHVS